MELFETMPITSGRLTEPEEAEGPYQYHLFLFLCENLAASTMVRNGAGEKRGCINLPHCSKGARNGGPRDTDLQHHQRTDCQNRN